MEADKNKTPYRVAVRDMYDFAERVSKRDVHVARALAEAIMGSENPEKPEGITIEFDDGGYAVVDFEDGQGEDLRASLGDSLPYFEREEWYELCARVKQYLARPQEKPKKTEKVTGTGGKNLDQPKQ